MNLLEVRDLSSGYGRLTVLRDLNLEVRQGEVAVVLGANGAGKTTTLRALCGTTWRRGSIKLEGKEISRLSTAAVAAAGVAQVPQGRGTFVDFTVEENLRLGGWCRPNGRDIAADMEKWMKVFPRLGERRWQQAGSLSGGEQQMLAIARAMMSRPRLLLLDEPSLGLAPLVTQELFRVLGEINRDTGISILVVEQNANLSLAIAHRAFVLENGYLALSGTAQEIRDDPTVQRIYLGAA